MKSKRFLLATRANDLAWATVSGDGHILAASSWVRLDRRDRCVIMGIHRAGMLDQGVRFACHHAHAGRQKAPMSCSKGMRAQHRLLDLNSGRR